MRKITIDFTAAKLLPDGNDLGYIGEHNATEITVIPPVEMANCESIATYVVAFATSNGVLYSDSFLKSEEITVPLTAKLTTDYYLGVQLEGYDSEGELVVKSPLVTQLQLSPSARGMGSETDSGSISGGVSVGSNHSHENKKVLDLIGQNGDDLTFNGGKIGGAVFGSKFYANDWTEGALSCDNYASPSVFFEICDEYPENRIITDISVRIETDGEDHDYSFFELIINHFIYGNSTVNIAKRPMYDKDTGMFSVAQISNMGDSGSSPFYNAVSISDSSVKGFTVHYLEV